MKKIPSVESMAKSVVRELKKLECNAWGQYAYSVQQGESMSHTAIENIICDLAESKVEKLALVDLAKLHDTGESSYGDEVEGVFEKYSDEGGMPIKDFLCTLQMHLRDSVRAMIEDEVGRIAADADLEKLDDGY